MANKEIKMGGIITDSKSKKNYYVGDLYVTKCHSDYKYNSDDIICVYDDRLQNVHMYAILSDELPKDSNLKCMELIKDTTDKIRACVLSSLQEKSNSEKIQFVSSSTEFDKILDDKSTIYVYGKNNGRLVCQDVKTYPLFLFIKAKVNGRTYFLNFMRFFIDKDNKINCILACPQFDRTIGRYVNKGKGGICYPTSYKGQRKFLSNMLEKSHDRGGSPTSYCYNPDISGFDINEEVNPKYANNLADRFIEFINANEEWIESSHV